MNKKGFTLTELIVVIVIIGLVLLIVIPVSSNIMQNNAKEKGTFYVQTLENAVNTYCDMYKTNKVTLKDLTDEGLFKTVSSNGVSTSLKEATFFRANGIVQLDGEELDDEELKIPVTINGTKYSCSKTECTETEN